MFDVHQDYYTHDEVDNDKVQPYIDGLMEEFAASPEAQPLVNSDEGIGWAAMMMEYGFNYLGYSPAKMGLRDFNEVLFELFPGKVSVDPEQAPAIVNELQAFWQFLQRQYRLDNAKRILATLDDSAVLRLRKELADPSNYGMAKSFFMHGQQAGFDMTTQEGLDQFQALYNAQILANQLGAMPFDGPVGNWPLLPPSPLSPQEKADKRKARKRQRQARKRNRRK